MRRPITPTGTNLLGLVKHLIAVEHVYLGTSFGRPPPQQPAWVADGSIWDGADMWARSDETREHLLGLYAEACAHSDRTVAELDLDSPGRVPHWPAEGADTTLGYLLVRMVAETAHHAGHADIVRELIDGRSGSDHDMLDEAGWQSYLARIQIAAESFRS